MWIFVKIFTGSLSETRPKALSYAGKEPAPWAFQALLIPMPTNAHDPSHLKGSFKICIPHRNLRNSSFQHFFPIFGAGSLFASTLFSLFNVQDWSWNMTPWSHVSIFPMIWIPTTEDAWLCPLNASFFVGERFLFCIALWHWRLRSSVVFCNQFFALFDKICSKTLFSGSTTLSP